MKSARTLQFRCCGAARSRPSPAASWTAALAACLLAGKPALAARRNIVKTAGDRGLTLPGRGGYGADAQYLGSPLQMANPFSGTQYSMQTP